MLNFTFGRAASWFIRASALFTLALLSPLPSPAQTGPAVLTANYDNDRTNSNLAETRLNPTTVNPNTFGKLYTLPVDGQVYAQPLYVPGVAIPNVGTRNVVYVATMHNSVYAFDADPTASRDPLWKVSLGPPVPAANYSVYAYYTDIATECGILGTPVIDQAAGIIYVVSANFLDERYSYQLHALDITSGEELQGGPLTISAAVAGNGDDSFYGAVVFDPFWHIQRPALLLATGVVYVAFGSHGDTGIYHGWLLGYNASDITKQLAVFNASPNSAGGSIWMSGRGLAVDAEGAIYAVTGNGEFDGIRDFGETALKLDGGHGLALMDWFTPFNYSDLNDVDSDLGSCGPVLIPGTKTLIVAGKGGTAYLLDTTRMGNLSPQDAAIPQSFRAAGGGVFNMALWNRADGPVLYLMGWNETFKAFRMSGGAFAPDPFSQTKQPNGYSYGGVTVTANGADATTGILWITTSQGGPPGMAWSSTLRAFDANDLTNELWNSDTNPLDTLPSFSKFVSPTVVGGRAYVPTFSNAVVVYGLKSDGAQALNDIQVVNALSLQGGGVSPGELVTITGSGIGPADSVRYQPDASGHLPAELSGVRVLFDGQAASLVSVAANSITAVVPYAVTTQSTTNVVVSYGNLTSNPLSLPVMQVTPGLAMAGAAPQGAFANEDGSQNSPDNPAPAGSVAQIAVTGIGATNPHNESLDESGINGLVVPELSAAIFVNGQQADILYLGGAPGLVGAMLSVRFRIPDTTPAGGTVPVVLKILDAASQTVTIAVSEPRVTTN